MSRRNVVSSRFGRSAWAPPSSIAAWRTLANGPVSAGSGFLASYAMSAGLDHGTGGPASMTPSVYDRPSVISPMERGNRATDEEGTKRGSGPPGPSPKPGPLGAPGSSGPPGICGNPAPPPTPGADPPPDPGGPTGPFGNTGPPAAGTPPGPPSPPPSDTIGHVTLVIANRW